jgi:hypothetical protein
MNLGEILHIGCSSIATWIYIFGGAGLGFEPGTTLQQSGMLTSRPRPTPNAFLMLNSSGGSATLLFKSLILPPFFVSFALND